MASIDDPNHLIEVLLSLNHCQEIGKYLSEISCRAKQGVPLAAEEAQSSLMLRKSTPRERSLR
jgi:hypothetical protein